MKLLSKIVASLALSCAATQALANHEVRCKQLNGGGIQWQFKISATPFPRFRDIEDRWQ